MKRSIEDTPIVFIGAGNLATNLAKALYRKGFRIVQVYSRTMESARTLAEKVEAEYTTDLQAVSKDAKLYIVSLKDDALVDLLPQITEGKQASLLLAISEYEPGSEYTYYWGSAWDKAAIKTPDAWNKYMTEYAQKLRTPLAVAY